MRGQDRKSPQGPRPLRTDDRLASIYQSIQDEKSGDRPGGPGPPSQGAVSGPDKPCRMIPFRRAPEVVGWVVEKYTAETFQFFILLLIKFVCLKVSTFI